MSHVATPATTAPPDAPHRHPPNESHRNQHTRMPAHRLHRNPANRLPSHLPHHLHHPYIHPPARHPAGTRLAAGLPAPPAFAFLPQRNRPVRHANRTGNPLTPPSDPSGLIPPQKCTNVSTVTNRNKNSALPMNAPSSPYTLLNHEKRPSTPAVAGVFLCAAQRSPTPRHPPQQTRQRYRPAS